MRGLHRFYAAVLVLLTASCGSDDVVDPSGSTGSLTVTVLGLPPGSNATVTVTGPAGFNRTLTATETLSALTPGSYTITGAAVTATEGRYSANPPTQSVTVVASTTATSATVSYLLVTGSLTVTVIGLPAGVNSAITVTGPNAFTRTVTSTTTFTALETGTYTVTSGEVTTTNDRYSTVSPTQTASVSAGASASEAVVVYALATGRLTVTVSGLPAGSGTTPAPNAAITVTGPQNFTRTVTGTTTIGLLRPGLYATTASNVIHNGLTWRPTPTSQASTVVASTTASNAAVTYAVIDGSLTVAVTGLPSGVAGAVTVTGPNSFNQTIAATTTFGTLPLGTYTVTATSVTDNFTTYTPTPLTQTATLTAGVATTAIVGYSAPVSIGLMNIASGLTRPVHLVAPPFDPRLFVVEQTGRIRIIQNGTLVPQPFLDISARTLPVTADDDEHGLLGLAFHPQYATNGFYFVFYMDPAQDLVVERYQVTSNPNVSGTAGTVVLRVPHALKKSHNGGGLGFGPDGYLYVSIGDGGCCADPLSAGQNLNTLLGKLLRIDVNSTPYTIPASNPFAGQSGRRGEIWAYGLRNPWRFDIDPLSSTLYIADVGEDDIEEVNAVSLSVSGPNFGWSIMEGSNCFQDQGCSPLGLRVPVVEYSHTEGCSITGGFVYRGALIPELQGHYFYSDWCSGFLRSFYLANGTVTQQQSWGVASPGNVTSFGRDSAGELYVLTQAGNVYRIVRQ
ncbi:MAG TPA: PQQ-dependent sugar dehydrogenase [Gemmatimonadaceae bacterium]|nr:PQQ-dependent sugar dehydrogenase [Gemmatimonadaceae bacterium]